MGWLIALGIVILLAILPLGASVQYDAGGPLVRVIAGPARIQVFPMKKKAKKEKTETDKPKAEKQKTEKAREEKPEDEGGSWKDFLPLVDVALDMLGDFRRKIRVNHLKLHLTMAGDDPCDLAVNYGRMNGALAALLAQLNRFFLIKKQDVRLNCDFTADDTTVIARLDLTITLGRLLALVVRHGIRALKTFLNIKKQREGGANL